MNQSPEQQIDYLGKKLGLDLVLDEKNQVLLLIDGKQPVSLRFSNDRWRFYGVIKYLDDDFCTQEQYQRFLAMNLNELQHGEGGMCLDESLRLLLYVGSMSTPVLNADDLYNSLEKFVGRIDALRLALAEHMLQ